MRIWIALAVFVLSVAPSSAQDGIVLESNIGDPPEEMRRLASPIYDELARLGFLAGPEVVGRRFEQKVSRPSIVDASLGATFAESVEQGHRAWISGQFADAVKRLDGAIDLAHANSGLFAQNQALTEKLVKGLVALALSQTRIGDQGAAQQAFEEILRSTPEIRLTRAIYGPDAIDAFESAKRQVASRGRGTLIVKPTKDGAVVFVNERFQAIGALTRSGLIPGEYRVVVQNGRELSRVHRVPVIANEETTLVIDDAFDAAVHTSPQWSGLSFADAAQRERYESVFAAAFANSIGARGVVVIALGTVRGRRAIIGSLVNLMTGREIRRASIQLDPDPSTEKLRSLARFVAGDNVAPGIDIQLAGEPTGVAGAKPDGLPRDSGGGGGSRMWGGWKWMTGVAGLGAMGVGAYLLSVDGDCTDPQCTYNRETSVSGWLSLSGGIVLTGISVYLFVHGSGDDAAPDRGAFIVPARGGAYAGYTLSF